MATQNTSNHAVSSEPLCRGLRFSEAYCRLPIAFEIKELAARWVGPLIDVGHDQWLGDMGQAGWGFLEGCGWSEALPSDDDFLKPNGQISKAWQNGLYTAAHRLAERAKYAGPESDPSVWLSWICFEISKPHAYVRALAEAN